MVSNDEMGEPSDFRTSDFRNKFTRLMFSKKVPASRFSHTHFHDQRERERGRGTHKQGRTAHFTPNRHDTVVGSQRGCVLLFRPLSRESEAGSKGSFMIPLAVLSGTAGVALAQEIWQPPTNATWQW